MSTRRLVVALALSAVAGTAHTQNAKPLGSVPLSDVTITHAAAGPMNVTGGKAVLLGNPTVTARPGHNAELRLARGGSVLLCQTSVLHPSQTPDAALLLALDRGALEIHMTAGVGDIIMTPDLRFQMATPGALDLRMRVTFNGDTCVENRGRKAPVLNITDSFGENSYEVRPGQHVLFERGSLREVVDRETTPCGCPPDERHASRGDSIAEALLRGGKTLTPQQAAAAHPFPEAVSAGLAAPDPPPAEATGVTHTQVATALVYNPTVAAPVATLATTAVASPIPPTPPPAPTRAAHPGAFVAIGHFFKRIFVR